MMSMASCFLRSVTGRYGAPARGFSASAPASTSMLLRGAAALRAVIIKAVERVKSVRRVKT